MSTPTLSHDEAEKHVLGSLMHRAEIIDEVADVLQPADMHAPRHETLYAAILHMHSTRQGVDPMTLAAHLTRTGDLAGVGGALYLHELYATPPTTANVGYYARIVADQAVRRRGWQACTRGAQMFASDEGDPTELVEHVRAEIDQVHRGTATTTFVSDTIDETLDSLDRPATTLPTPWPELNDIVKGWRPGGLYVVGARPGIGKTIVGVQAALGLTAHGAVAFSSLEMPRTELELRIIANIAEVPLGRLDSRSLTPGDWERIARTRAHLADLPVSIDDRGTVTVTDVRSHARSVARKAPLAGVVVDYLQLMSTPRGDRRPRHEVVGDYSRALKLLAKELECPVIALSQLNRASEVRHDKRPQLSDLRESGAVEQDSDVVLLLHEDEDDETALDMLVAKNRHGARGGVRLVRRGWYSRIDGRPWSPTRNLEGAAS